MKAASIFLWNRPRPLVGLAIALAAFAVALGARVALDHTLPPGFPFVTFFPAVILTSFLAGTRAGLLCAVLSGVASWYFLPQGDVARGQRVLAMAFYAFICAIDIGLIYVARRALRRVEDEKAVSAGLVDQQSTMFTELQHRVSNNMALIASLLNMSRRRVAADPASAPAVLDEARARIETMARIHRLLHDPNQVAVGAHAYLDQLCRDIVGLADRDGIALSVEAPRDLDLDIGTLTPLSLFISELITNSLKHAFPEGRNGRITVRLARADEGAFLLSVSDNGVGMPQGTRESTGLGVRIVQALASQLKGRIEQTASVGGGVSTTLAFPPRAA